MKMACAWRRAVVCGRPEGLREGNKPLENIEQVACFCVSVMPIVGVAGESAFIEPVYPRSEARPPAPSRHRDRLAYKITRILPSSLCKATPSRAAAFVLVSQKSSFLETEVSRLASNRLTHDHVV